MIPSNPQTARLWRRGHGILKSNVARCGTTSFDCAAGLLLTRSSPGSTRPVQHFSASSRLELFRWDCRTTVSTVESGLRGHRRSLLKCSVHDAGLRATCAALLIAGHDHGLRRHISDAELRPKRGGCATTATDRAQLGCLRSQHHGGRSKALAISMKTAVASAPTGSCRQDFLHKKRVRLVHVCPLHHPLLRPPP